MILPSVYSTSRQNAENCKEYMDIYSFCAMPEFKIILFEFLTFLTV